MSPETINSAIEKLEAALAELKAAKREIEAVCEVDRLGKFEIKTWDKRGFASQKTDARRYARYESAEHVVCKIRSRFCL